MPMPLSPVFAERRQRLANFYGTLGPLTGFVEPLACAMAKVLFDDEILVAAPDLRDWLGMDQAEYIWVFREGELSAPHLLSAPFVAGKLLLSINFTPSGRARQQQEP